MAERYKGAGTPRMQYRPTIILLLGEDGDGIGLHLSHRTCDIAGINLEITMFHVASSTFTSPEVIYYAHTSEAEGGRRLPKTSGRWQPLAEHLRQTGRG